jgi:exonuclease SbcC
MAMFSFRGKPGWESHDAAERASAVATSTDPALLARLTDLARSDEAAGVRRAAVRRLLDLPLLGDRARNDADPEVRAAAQERYRQLLAGIGEQPLPRADRERVLRSEDNPELLAWMAVNSREPALRRMALEQHAKPGLLLDRCQRDPDPAIRLWLLEQISDLAALERIAEATRKSDKRLSHAARERAEMLRFAAGDAEALKRRALAIAESLDQLRRERPHDLEPRAAALRAEWEALAARVDPAIVQRVQGYIDTLAAVLAPARAVPVTPAQAEEPAGLPTIEASAETAVEPAAPATPRDPDPELLAQALESEGHSGDIEPAALDALRQRHASAWHRERDHLAAELDAHQRFEVAVEGARSRHAREAEARSRRAAEATAAFELLEAAVQAQQAQEARDRHAVVQALRAERMLPAALNRRLAAIDETYDKLIRWQHWSNNKVRARLCEDIEALSTAGAHPDAVATKVREVQAEWQRLDASERLDASASAKIGLSRRFRAVCHRALAPARGYFEKRSELRDQRRALIDGVLARAEGELSFDPAALVPLRRELIDAMRRLDELDPRARAGLGKRLRAALDRLDAARDSRNSAFEAEKRKIIANLRRQLAQADGPEAVALARDAQARIGVLPRAGREAEEAIRSELAALVDPLFATERAQREGEQSALRQREADQAAVLAELAALASGDAEALRQADARLAMLSQRWRDLAPPAPAPAAPTAHRDGSDGRMQRDARGGRDQRDDRQRGRPPRDDRGRDDERRFDAAVERVRAAQKQAQERARHADSARWLQIAAACAVIESASLSGPIDASAADALRASIETGTPNHPALRARVEQALRWVENPPGAESLRTAHAAAQQAAALLALRAEALLGVESPAEFREQRRAWQIQRLAERMSGGAAPDPVRERKQLLDGWLAVAPLQAEERAAFARRIEPGLENR